jgi:hypothetical protein
MDFMLDWCRWVIDYTREDFTKTEKQYDLILDVIAHRSVLPPAGTRPRGNYFFRGSTATMFQICSKPDQKNPDKNIRILVVPHRSDPFL